MLNLSESMVSQDYRAVLLQFAPLALAIGEVLRTGQPIVRRKLAIASNNPQVTHLGVSVSPLTARQDELHGVICLFSDLTPVIEMEEQLHLKDSLARVGELTAGIAHEFRNGLATIHGYARLLDMGAMMPAQRQHLEGIRQETDALGQVVTNFLNFAKPSRPSFSHVDLRTIVERAADEVRGEARAHAGHVEIRGEFPTIDGDDVLLRQAVSNLLRNAMEATMDASTAPEVVITGHAEGGVVRLSVEDNGPGIPVWDRERVFTPFFTTKGKGTGLGLALVQKIVVTHNGKVQIGRSALGGASFQVTLPINAEEELSSAL
jgi:signal transduction histidine kinase